MSEYEDAHMKDENGVSWVKVEYANKVLNPPRAQEPLRYMTLPVNIFAVFSEDEDVEIAEDATSYEQAEALLKRLREEYPNHEWTLFAEVGV